MPVDDLSDRVGGVSIVRWNPRRDDGVTVSGRVDNFGDLLGPIIASRLMPGPVVDFDPAGRRLLAVGSIMHFGRPGDVVWGAGFNAKLKEHRSDLPDLDVRAVRGPYSRLLLEAAGLDVPEVYGDPALLLPELFPETRSWAEQKVRQVVIVPNLHDEGQLVGDDRVVSPRGPVWEVVRAIASADLVVGSSLHGIVIAESLGVPARLVAPEAEHPMKYVDYYAGTGRHGIAAATDVDEAIRLGGAAPIDGWSSSALIGAFPVDLWAEDRPGAVERRKGGSSGRGITDVVSDVSDLRRSAVTPFETDAAEHLAERIVLRALAHDADRFAPESLAVVLAEFQATRRDGALADVDPRYSRAVKLAELGFTPELRRNALASRPGHRVLLLDVHRAGDDGVLVLGGRTTLPDTAWWATDAIVEAVAHDAEGEQLSSTTIPFSVLDVDESTGTMTWECRVDVARLPEGVSAVLWSLSTPIHGEVVVPVDVPPDLSFNRWGLGDGTAYRVDRTTRGHLVLHHEPQRGVRP